jgi:hypothetical protein
VAKTIWVTKDGTKIRVRAMTDSHLLNTVAMLRRNAEAMMLREVMSMGAYAADRDGTIAADVVGDACAELGDMEHDEYLEGTVPAFAAMLNEIERRGLHG